LDRIGILVVSKCLSAAAIIDALSGSPNYAPEFFVVEKQLNPFNFQRAKVHSVVPDLDLKKIVKFAARYKDRISFALTDTEDFITAGGRDLLEKETGIPAVCVSRKYATEASKADQRLLFGRLFDDANPRFKVFDKKDYRSDEAAAVSDFKRFAAKLGEPVIKPDAPARGAGVGVWGSDFRSEQEMVDFFRNVYSKGRVVVEERVEGEESSFHAFSDGERFIVAPQTRDYKRALEENKGRLTGGMGSYRSPGSSLPFLRPSEWESVVEAERLAFRRWKGRGSNPGLRGIVLYDALMHTGRGFKVLERNSRGGNTEQINILTTMQDDLVEVCFRMIEGKLKTIKFSNHASVVTCVVPEEYGTGAVSPKMDRFVDLTAAQALEKDSGGRLRVYPMDLRLGAKNDALMGSSRSVAVVGVAGTIEEAREISVSGAEAVRGDVRFRRDIASKEDLDRSASRMRALRRRS
jgi:phosphoribosylamine---glycine ligase